MAHDDHGSHQPTHPTLPTAEEYEDAPQRSSCMGRILLVDDDVGLLDVLTMSLSDAGHEVVTARDGLDGLQAFADHKPGVAVVDVQMPRLDGFSLTRRLRAQGDR